MSVLIDKVWDFMCRRFGHRWVTETTEDMPPEIRNLPLKGSDLKMCRRCYAVTPDDNPPERG